jgi:hypothetical protein
MAPIKYIFHLFIFSLIVTFITTSCTKEITANLPDYGTNIVIDGNIETNTPPIVLLTRSTKVFGDLNINDIGSFFVHGADVTVTMDSTVSVKLEEICLKDLSFLPDTQKRDLLKSLGILVYDSNTVPNVCVYTLPVGELITYFNTGTCSFVGQEKHRYDLSVKTNGKTLTAYTTLPESIPADSLSYRPHSNPKFADSLVNVFITIKVPNTYGHFIRYWTKRNNEPFYAPTATGSVFDDKLFIGQTYTLPTERGQASNEKRNDTTFGYFWKGDTVTVKWANIDSRTYDFFYTLENDGGGSPFSSPVKAKTNINGGLGVWAGYSTKYYKIVIPK